MATRVRCSLVPLGVRRAGAYRFSRREWAWRSWRERPHERAPAAARGERAERQALVAQTMVHGYGEATLRTVATCETKRWKPAPVQWFRWPGVLPRSLT